MSEISDCATCAHKALPGNAEPCDSCIGSSAWRQEGTPIYAPLTVAATGTEANVCADIARRQQAGVKKYGMTVEQNAGALGYWLQHGYEEALDLAVYLKRAMAEQEAQGGRKLKPGQRVRKTKGSAWTGRVCGTYSTELTPEGYAVESDAHPGSVQIYPATMLEAME